MGLFDSASYGDSFSGQEKQQIQAELDEIIKSVIDQFSPLMEGLLNSLVKVYENDELINRIIWLQAGHSGKMLKALQENGFSREEALTIVTAQGGFIANAISSLNSSK